MAKAALPEDVKQSRFLATLNWFKNHKKASFGLVVVVVLTIVYFKLISSPGAGVYKVKSENLINTVLINGNYSVAAQTQVSSPTNGVITQLYVENGQEVKKGDDLFHVESSATESEKKAAYATYLTDSSALKADQATLYSLQSTMYSKWKTYTDLATNSTYQKSDGSPNETNRVLPEFTTAQDDWLKAEADFKNQQAVIAADQAALSSSLQSYNETQSTTVVAPIKGEVINLASKVNDQVHAKTATSTKPVLSIADFANPQVVSEVDQVNIPKLKIGQQADIVFDALPNQTFGGTIENIDSYGTKTQGTVNFGVYIKAENLPDTIKPNMSATITIETARKENVLTVPNEAITKKDGKNYVQLVGHGKNDLTEVGIGLKGLTKTEITSGLKKGDKVQLPQ